MRRISFFVVFACLLFSAGIFAQTSITPEYDNTMGFYGDSIRNGQPVKIDLRYEENDLTCRMLPTNAFVVYSTDGATFTDLWGGTYSVNGFTDGFDNTLVDTADGTPAEKIGFGGVTIFGCGWRAVAGGGTNPFATPCDGDHTENFVPFYITFTAGTEEGSHICLDSSSYTGFTWVWSTLVCDPVHGDIKANWAGPYCFEIYTVPDEPPVFDNPAAPGLELTTNHCTATSFDFLAHDPDGPDVITYSADFGTIDPSSGAWSWVPGSANIGDVTVTITADEGDGAISTYQVLVHVTNEGPVFTGGCGTKNGTIGGHVEVVFTTTNDCPGETTTYSIETQGSAGTASFTGNVLSYDVDAGVTAGTYLWVIGASDGNGGFTTCDLEITLIAGNTYEVKIEKFEDAYQGTIQELGVTIDIAGAFGFGGFDLLFAYDASALTFLSAEEGESMLYNFDTGCEWEYFEYRTGPFGNCGSACPTGMVTVVGMAESNNGAYHPDEACSEGYDGLLFKLKFLVTNDRTFECQYIPVKFYWMSCADNTISDWTGEFLYVSDMVWDYGWNEDEKFRIDTFPAVYPTYFGFQADECEEGKVDYVRDVGFFNGGFDIPCADSIDDRGDLNLDGIPNTIADAVMYTNYFIKGLTALVYVDAIVGYEASIAASDVNADGIPLSVADLVYLIRVIIGDAFPYSKVVSPVNGQYFVNSGVLSVDMEMGAIYAVYEGNANVKLLDNSMEMKSEVRDGNTHVIIYSLDGNATIGDVVSSDASLVSVEMAAADGSPVSAKLIPSDFGLEQNYPNPFNPTTTIEFSLPYATDYSLTIYNVTGQVVDQFSGSADAGIQSITWNASGSASGIYFYKLNAGDFSATKKMVLLK